VRIFRSEPSISCGPPRVLGLLGDYASTLALALSNLVIALELAAIFAAFNLTLIEGGAASVALLVAGVFGGSVLLWGTLTVASGFIRFRFDQRALRWINRAAGALITGFGLLVLLSLVLKHG
jgi:threonine/homoserine/homoserine lactone efflux protein